MAQGIGKFKAARVAGAHLESTYKGYGGQLDDKTVAAEHVLVPKWIHHFAGTQNHWSDIITSIDILVFVLVPFLRREITRCGFAEGSHAILILDCWYGWTSPVFKNYQRANYPWIHLVYVPGRCTPWAQPADRGFITRLKACLRKYSADLITDMVVHQLFTERRPPDCVSVDIKGATACKKNLAVWTAKACEELDALPDVVQSYWSGIGVEEKITTKGLLDAWEKPVQDAAWERRAALFKNLAQEDDPTSDAAGTFSEPPQDAADAGFGDELPGMEQALRDGGVLRDDPPGGAAEGAASYEDAVSFLDDFVARLDARMAAASKVVPAAENLQAIIFEVAANVTAADNGAAFPSDEEDDEEEADEEDEEEEADEEDEEEEADEKEVEELEEA